MFSFSILYICDHTYTYSAECNVCFDEIDCKIDFHWINLGIDRNFFSNRSTSLVKYIIVNLKFIERVIKIPHTAY